MHTPQSAEAERAVIGAMLIDPAVIPAILSIVTSSAMFHSEVNAAIFDQIVSLDGMDERADLVTLQNSVNSSGVIADAGGFGYVEAIVAQTPSAVGAESYAKIVKQKWVARELQVELDAICRAAGDEPIESLLSRAESAVARLSDCGLDGQSQDWRDTVSLVAERVSSGMPIPTIPTHFADLDDMLGGGFRPSEMIVLGARPSMGKSALMQNICENMAVGGMPRTMRRDEVPVGVFSLEMSKAQLAARSISRWSSLSMQMIRRGEGGDMIAEAAETIASAPMHIDDRETTIGGVRAKARQMVRKHGVSVIFIDYLQLISDPSTSRHGRYEEVSSVSRQIKRLAMSLNVPVVALCQLNRSVEGQSNHRPRMKDLRDSGAIEQDADVVMLLHREDYYDEQVNPGMAMVDVAKQRNGPTGHVMLCWDAECVRFQNAAKGQYS